MSMDSPYSPLEFAVLNGWQRDFPLQPRPYAVMAEKLGAGEAALLDTVRRLHGRGAISRVGAVFAPGRIGAGTLATLAAPVERLEEIAALVSKRAEVNHNYQREHHWNLWFVATTRSQPALQGCLTAIEEETGCQVLAMPLRREYHIDLGFDLAASGAVERPKIAIREIRPRVLSAAEERLCEVLEPGLPLLAEPYAELARQCGLSETEVLRYLGQWREDGLIKRFGVVVRHHEMGFRANAMVVFDIADDEVDAVGARLATEPAVTLCYQRQRCAPQWPFNLYCMVHGRDRSEVEPAVDRLAAAAGRKPTVLFSVRRFKQCGARYFSSGKTA